MGQHAAARVESAGLSTGLSAPLARITEKLADGGISRRSLFGGGLAAASAPAARAVAVNPGE